MNACVVQQDGEGTYSAKGGRVYPVSFPADSFGWTLERPGQQSHEKVQRGMLDYDSHLSVLKRSPS